MKKLIPSICLLLIAASMLGTSTFAWFSMNGSATATGLTVTAEAPKSLMIRTNGSSWSSSVVVSDITSTTPAHALASKIEPSRYVVYNQGEVAFYILGEYGKTIVQTDGSLNSPTGYFADAKTSYSGTLDSSILTSSSKYVLSKGWTTGTDYFTSDFAGTPNYSAIAVANEAEYVDLSTVYVVDVAEHYEEAKDYVAGTQYYTFDTKYNTVAIDSVGDFDAKVNGSPAVKLYYKVANTYKAATAWVSGTTYYLHSGSDYSRIDATAKCAAGNGQLTQTEYNKLTNLYIKEMTAPADVAYYAITADGFVQDKTYYARDTNANQFIKIYNLPADEGSTIAKYAEKYASNKAYDDCEKASGALKVYEYHQLYSKSTEDYLYTWVEIRSEGSQSGTLGVTANFLGEVTTSAATAMHLLFVNATTKETAEVDMSTRTASLPGFKAAGTTYYIYYYMDGTDAECYNAAMATDASMNVKLTFSYN